MVRGSTEPFTPSTFKDNVKSVFQSIFAPFLRCCSTTPPERDGGWTSADHGSRRLHPEQARDSQRSHRSTSRSGHGSTSVRGIHRNDVHQSTTRSQALFPPPSSSSIRGNTNQVDHGSIIQNSRGSRRGDVVVHQPTTHSQALFPPLSASNIRGGTRQRGSDVFTIPVQQPKIRSHNLIPDLPSSLEPTKQFPTHVLAAHAPPNWSNYYSHGEIEFINISPSDEEYSIIKGKFNEYYSTDTIRIQQIQRIENYYLWSMYQLKKEELQRQYGYCRQIYLFHATRAANVSSICADNLNWRLYGKSKGFKFGKGVSFSPRSSYASHFSDQNYEGPNKMLVVRVLQCRLTHAGWPPPDLPPRGCDTTRNDKGTVIVKYEDHTFYPEFLITYAGRCP